MYNPFTSIRPQESLFQTEETTLLLRPDLAKCGSLLLRIPPEILLLILEYLAPSDLIRFFCTSKWALSFVDLFCRSNPFHFYRCDLNVAGDMGDKRILIIALSTWPQFPELDTRWQVVREAAELAKLVPFMDQKGTAAQTFDPRAPLQLFNHNFGLYEDILDIPLNAKSITIYRIRLRGRHYVCGIGFDTGQSSLFIGNITTNFYTKTVPSTAAETIGIAVDALGLRSINYGACQPCFGNLESIDYWEGLSALKFRDLSWHHKTPLFEETILMKNRHPSLSGHGFISKEYYVQQHPEQERQLVNKFGKLPVETMRFDEDLKTIKIYTGDGFGGITGLCNSRTVHT
ncbi:hypothetical protein LOZ57_002167 [Ophidiomyces ophidiicola]|uniref:uncharacterized protein n=1 Tax=Ophidiomyces ophidiicola TaxID=1387563 RepID=UPI0020C34A05|nr:uncharacterized protein LOZ57_002167 [Ophidiomyces ophidiicola]KAI1950604.1 hypothetical protein LOZ57_002167 [Ophidiomyces ophidiicola]KAI2047117.1 hypothetical protein LOZ43_005711 [Ophidiomyces ophidiicola]